MSTEQDQKATLEKKLTNALKDYYRNLIQLDFNLGKDLSGGGQGQKMLFDDEGFGNCYTFIKDTVLGLAKNTDLMLALIKKHNSW